MATSPLCTTRGGGNSRGQCRRLRAFRVVTPPAGEQSRQPRQALEPARRGSPAPNTPQDLGRKVMTDVWDPLPKKKNLCRGEGFCG